MSIKVLLKKKQYIKLLETLVKANASKEEINLVYIAYKKFCFDNKLTDNLDSHELFGDQLIVDAKIVLDYTSDDKIALIADRLKEAIDNNDGISLEEADILLKWSVRNSFEAICGEDNRIAHMKANEYYAVAIMAFPFINIGVPVTINNTKYFNEKTNHPFVTITLPIKMEDAVIEKQYLVDISYSQFFTMADASFANFYDAKGPLAGFYVCNTERGKEFACELITNGYVELSIDNARIYGASFFCQSSGINNENDFTFLMNIDGETYRKIINTKQDELLYSMDTAEFNDIKVKFPALSKVKK